MNDMKETFNFDYHSDNAKDLLIKALAELGFEYYDAYSGDFHKRWKHGQFVVEDNQMVIFGLNNKSNVIEYSPKDHMFYWISPDSEALTRCDPNIKDLESLICLYLK